MEALGGALDVGVRVPNNDIGYDVTFAILHQDAQAVGRDGRVVPMLELRVVVRRHNQGQGTKTWDVGMEGAGNHHRTEALGTRDGIKAIALGVSDIQVNETGLASGVSLPIITALLALRLRRLLNVSRGDQDFLRAICNRVTAAILVCAKGNEDIITV